MKRRDFLPAALALPLAGRSFAAPVTGLHVFGTPPQAERVRRVFAVGAAYQGMFRNPLVSPDILGVAAGAGLGAALAIYFGLPLIAVQAVAFAGGLAAVAVVVFVAGQVRRHDPVLVLAGVAVGTLFSAGISLIKVLADPNVQLPSITFWLLGGLNAVAAGDLWVAAPLVVVGLTPMLLLRWRVNLLSLSDEEAAALGGAACRSLAALPVPFAAKRRGFHHPAGGPKDGGRTDTRPLQRARQDGG